MKDLNKTSGNESVSKSTYKAEYAEHLWFALVDCLTVDLAHGEAVFYTENRIHKDVFREFMANQGYDVDRARNSAILLRRAQRKERTKARNEKIKTDSIAAREERRRMKAEREQKEGWATDGFLLYQKRLERGSFELPRINPVTGYYELSWETFSFIMAGVSLESVQFRKCYRTRFVGR